MEESFWVKEIKLLLLDHAAKHKMKDVVKHILKDKAILEHVYKKISELNAQEEETHSTTLFLLLLDHLKESLQKFQVPVSSNKFSWDRENLSLIISILDATYKQKHFVDFSVFMKLLKLLKHLVLFRMVFENVDGRTVCATLNLHFPHWVPESHEKFMQAYGSENEAYAGDIKEATSEIRKFILKLLLHNKWREIYLRTNYGADVQKMVLKSLPLLDMVINAIRNLIGPSTLEQIFSYTNGDVFSSNDPTVQIILEYLKPDMTETDFLELLKILEFPECQDDSIDITFGSPLEEMLNILRADDDCALEERGLDSVIECAAAADVIAANAQKRYGPLGLGPPSTKKPTLDEASEVQVIQEHMEFVADSEDEEQL